MLNYYHKPHRYRENNMTGFYDKLEEISDSIDWFIEDAAWRYNKLGWELALLKFVPWCTFPYRLAMDLRWSTEEAESCTQYIGDKTWPEAKYNVAAAQAAAFIYRVAYNKHKYFWMRKI